MSENELLQDGIRYVPSKVAAKRVGLLATLTIFAVVATGAFAFSAPEQFATLIRARDYASEQLPAAASASWFDSLADNFYNAICPYFTDCKIDFSTETARVPQQLPQQPTRPALATSSPPRATAPAQSVQQIVNNPVIERHTETVRVESGITAALEARFAALTQDFSNRLSLVSNTSMRQSELIADASSDALGGTLEDLTINDSSWSGGTIIGALIDTAVATISDLTANTIVAVNATTTNLSVSGTASTTNLVVSSAGGSTGCAQFSVLGLLSNTGTPCGTGSGGTDFIFATNYGALAAATTSPIWAQSGIFASSTSHFVNLDFNSATSTGLSYFLNGLISSASTTIGSGSQAGGLTISGSATTTGNQYIAGSLGLGTTSPYAKLSVVGEVVARNFTATSTSATSTFAGGLNVNSGAITHDFSSGLTSIDNLAIDALSFAADSGIVSWIDMPVTTAAATGTVESYSAKIDGTDILTVYSRSDGMGGIWDPSVGIGSTSPWGMLSVEQQATNTPVFVVADQGTSSPHLLVHQAKGFTGIGTSTPWARLSVHAAAGENSFAIGSSTGTYFLVNSSGNVGIGTTNPDNGKVEVKGGTVCVDTNSDDNASSCIANESDERLKTNVETLSASSSLDVVLALNPVSFDWRARDPGILKHYPLLGRFASSTHSIGLIAQQVAPFVPEAIQQETVGDSQVQYLQLDYTKFIPHLIGAIKEITNVGGVFREKLVAWFANTANGIGELYARVFKGERVETQELCIDDVCVTRDQFAEVFGGSQNAAAAGAPSSGVAASATEGSDADAATSTASNVAEPQPLVKEAANDNPQPQGAEQSLHDDNHPPEATADTQLVEPPPAEPEPDLAPANDNSPPAEQLPATGTE